MADPTDPMSLTEYLLLTIVQQNGADSFPIKKRLGEKAVRMVSMTRINRLPGQAERTNYDDAS